MTAVNTLATVLQQGGSRPPAAQAGRQRGRPSHRSQRRMAQMHNELLKDMAQLPQRPTDQELESLRNFASLRDDIENLRI